jgi:pilus assembly protein CpaC
MIRKLLALVAVILSGLLLSGGVDAAVTSAPAAAPATVPRQAAPAGSTIVTPPSGAPSGPTVRSDGRPETIPANGPTIMLQVNQGTLIRLPGPASTVFIADPRVADVAVKSPTLIYLLAKTPGTTSLYAVDAKNSVLLARPVRVGPNVGPLRAALQQIKALGLGDDVHARWLNNTLILGGTVATARRAELVRAAAATVAGTIPGATVLDRLAIATPNQVNIRVKIALVDRSATKALGINLDRAVPAACSAAAGLLATACPHFAFSTGVSTAAPNYQAVIGTTNPLIATINLLASEGLAKTLAEPNLTVMNNQTASFISGGTIYLQSGVTSAGTSGTIVTTAAVPPTPIPFGTQLYVTPTIIDPAHLKLQIRPVFSSIAAPVNGQTTLSQQSAETTVELGSGETFALAGLIQEVANESISKVPGLGDIPYIGQLFRSENLSHTQTEVVILVTPYLVEPSRTVLATPADGLKLPTDLEAVATGALYRQGLPSPARGPLQGADHGLIGPVGFQLN